MKSVGLELLWKETFVKNNTILDASVDETGRESHPVGLTICQVDNSAVVVQVVADSRDAEGIQAVVGNPAAADSRAVVGIRVAEDNPVAADSRAAVAGVGIQAVADSQVAEGNPGYRAVEIYGDENRLSEHMHHPEPEGSQQCPRPISLCSECSSLLHSY